MPRLPIDRLDNLDVIGDSKIPVREEMKLLDSSKIQSLMDCPRAFFFSHILGWESTDPNIHLIFGSAWHEALEHLLQNGGEPAIVREAYQKFMDIYSEEFEADPLASEHYAKNPENAFKALAQFSGKYPLRPEDTIYTEVAGTAPIREDRSIHFKLDAIRRHPPSHEEAGKYYVLDHKTTSRKSKSWMNKWSYKFQVTCYIHVMNSWLGDPDKLDGLTVNGSIFRKNDVEHVRIPVQKSGEQMLEFLWEANNWWDYYEEQLYKLYNSSPDDTYMEAFPRNTESCCKFGCRYPGICNTTPNPLKDWREKTPTGYKKEYWDPTRGEDEANHVVNLEEDEN